MEHWCVRIKVIPFKEYHRSFEDELLKMSERVLCK